ncbi:type VI immunity family protein [Salmonella bongori]|uniref:type VI immunity family protein n=1 Tax=Salmonella bongori TaxID=54736 RepID=UPI0015EB4954|nr:type VI immunity family protein [Salmonella bongori]MBA3226381.1 DUF3396 domain-containing protein [Salmonella bongori]
MSDNKTLPDIDNNALAELDKVKIMGRVAVEARIALGVELFIAPPGEEKTPQMYQDMLTSLEAYYQHFKPHLNCYLLPNSRSNRMIKGNPVPVWRKALENVDMDYGFNFELFYDDTWKREAFNASPWRAGCMGLTPEENQLSNITGAMPVCNDEGDNHFATLFAMTLAWCERHQPVHGSAGFCYALCTGIEPQARYTWASMQRFPGIDFFDPVIFSLRVKENYNRIKGVNWLTILGDTLVAELGGVETLTCTLEPECRIHPYRGGIIIIAGPVPQTGDLYTGFTPQRYKKVAAVTRPVRFDNYRRPFLSLPEQFDSMEATLKWVRRFD